MEIKLKIEEGEQCMLAEGLLELLQHGVNDTIANGNHGEGDAIKVEVILLVEADGTMEVLSQEASTGTVSIKASAPANGEGQTVH